MGQDKDRGGDRIRIRIGVGMGLDKERGEDGDRIGWDGMGTGAGDACRPMEVVFPPPKCPHLL